MVNKILWNLAISAKEDKEDLKGYRVWDVTSINDGRNEPSSIAILLLDILRDVVAHKEIIVIQCQAGISRSNALATGILVLAHNLDFDDALRMVKALNPRANPNLDILNCVREAVKMIQESWV